MGKKSSLKRINVAIIRACGTNCDIETENAFRFLGVSTYRLHINELLYGKEKLDRFDIVALPGGFSFGDDISAGKIFALRIKKLYSDFKKFIESKRPIIGICNGFQVLAKSGLLPHPSFKQQITLYFNDSGQFICKWVRLRINRKSPCIFTKNLPDEFYLPVAHSEGKFVACDEVLEEIKNFNLDALIYIDNPNGSFMNIAGVTNKCGNVFGLMPHPERAFFSIQLPWKGCDKDAVGYQFFKNAVDYVR
ncbi:MAG: phosphoribosylformylglycinamidine synthase I [Elusimicrobiales bacterium]